MAGDLVNLLADLKEQEALALVRERIDRGEDPMAVLDDARAAMEVVGRRFEENTYFIPDLVYSGEILKTISEIIKPLLVKEKEEADKLGKVLIGTVAGDIHDIGKNIVAFLLEVNGFDVRDIGVDVPAAKFVEAIKEFEPDVVGLSCLLTVAFDAMKDTITAIRDAGLRDRVKIMIGGGVVDENLVPYVGADGFEQYASGAVTISKKWLGIKTD
jgi:5-methyltetrahydrofolate--homocysteine methyltransferase